MSRIIDVVELTDLEIPEADEWYTVPAYGRLFFGNSRTRPYQVVGNKLCYCSVKEPIRGSGFGVGGGTSSLSVTKYDGLGGVMKGAIRVKEAFGRELTKEGSEGSEQSDETTLAAGGSFIIVQSTAAVPSTEKFISTRDFYVRFTDKTGDFHLAAQIPYTEGSGAQLDAILDGQVTALTLGSAGSGYTSAPTVALTGGGGSGATATAVTTGKVTSIAVDTAGSYNSAPTVIISGGGGSGATATAVLGVGPLPQGIASINVTNQGSGYTSAPTISFSGGGSTGGGAATATVNTVITGLTITNAGTGYTSAPTVGFSGGGGSGATGTATISKILSSISITNAGSGYTVAPALVIAGGGGTGARATCKVSGGAIQSVTIVNAGSGYTSTPVVYVDAAYINTASTQITKNRKLESSKERSVYPAVHTMTFWRQRACGARVEDRVPNSGAFVTLTAGSNRAVIEGDTWRESDVIKGIVDYNTNEIVAFIDRILSPTIARLVFPGTVEITTWQRDTVTLFKWGLSGDSTNVYLSGLYNNEASGGLTVGLVTWNPLDVLRNDTLYGSGASIAFIERQNEDLLLVYNRAIAVYQGEVSVGAPPNVRPYVVAEGVGASATQAWWKDNAGRLWFQGNGRFWMATSGGASEASSAMGVSQFWRRNIASDADTQKYFQAAFNPERNLVVLCRLSKAGEAGGDEWNKYSVALCLDSNSVNPLRWPVPFYCLLALQHTNGAWQFYAGSDEGRLYRALVRGLKSDTYYDTEDVLQEDELVAWTWTSGNDFFSGDFYPQAVQLVIESEETTGCDVSFSYAVKKGGRVSRTFTAQTAENTFTQTRIENMEAIPVLHSGGKAIQYRFSGSTAKEFTLVHATIIGRYVGRRALSGEAVG
jgi:hypothetical protein